MNAERSKTRLGIMGMIMSKSEMIKKDAERSMKYEKTKIETYPTLRAVPIYWGSFKSPRVATPTFGAKLQAIFHAVDLGTMLRCLVSELVFGQPRVEIQVDVRNDGLNVLNCLHGLTNIQQEKRLIATVASVREAIQYGDINSVSFVSGPIYIADALTKCTTGTNIYNLMVYNIVPVIPFEVLTEMWKNHQQKNNIF